MLASAALSTARRKRGLLLMSPPPRRAATVISLIRRVQILPRLASVAAFLCLILAHLLCPAMTLLSRRGYGAGRTRDQNRCPVYNRFQPCLKIPAILSYGSPFKFPIPGPRPCPIRS